MDWIPCKERLPDKDGEYLVTVGIKTGWFVDICELVDGKWIMQCGEVSNITAWMSLPDPYQQ